MAKAKATIKLPDPDPYAWPEEPRMGRPPIKEYDLKQIESLASVGCTQNEIAALCGYSQGNFHDLKKNHPDIQEALDRGRSNLHKSLRRKQVDLALDGNVPMLIHLGKTQLGQSEKLTLAGDKENPLAVIRLKWGDEVEAESSGSDASESDTPSS